MSEFIRPQVQVEEINETSARVSVEPLERGYGDTPVSYTHLLRRSADLVDLDRELLGELTKSEFEPVKVLGNGELTKKFTVKRCV